MKFLAILKDSLIQTLDCKSLYVMLVLSGIFILLCASISYSPMDEEQILQDVVNLFRIVQHGKGLGMSMRDYGVKFEVSQVRRVDDEGGLFRGAYEFRIAARGKDEWRKLVRHWDALRTRSIAKEGDPVPHVDVDPDEELERRFLRGRFREHMLPQSEVLAVSGSGDERVFDVRVRPHSRETLQGAHRVHVLFGLWSVPLRAPFSVSMFVFMVQSVLSEWGAGLVGVAMALLFTGGFIPGMLQKGSLDVLLARPVRRPTLLLLKYVGGLTYGVISGAVFIGGSWLVLSVRSGVWNWGYLATLGTLVFFFGVLYSIGVFFAVLTRSTIAAIVMPFIAWACSSGLDWLRKVLLASEVAARVPKALWSVLDAFYYVLPKPSSLNDVNVYLMAKGSFGAVMEGSVIQVPEIAWAPVILSQLGLVAVMLALSCWIFARRDN